MRFSFHHTVSMTSPLCPPCKKLVNFGQMCSLPPATCQKHLTSNGPTSPLWDVLSGASEAAYACTELCLGSASAAFLGHSVSLHPLPHYLFAGQDIKDQMFAI